MLHRVQHERGILPAAAAPVLRPAIMRGASPGFDPEPGAPPGIPHRVGVVRPPGYPSNFGKFASRDERLVYVSGHALGGWGAVDWRTGTVGLDRTYLAWLTTWAAYDPGTGATTEHPVPRGSGVVEVGWTETCELLSRRFGGERQVEAPRGRAHGSPDEGRAARARRGPQRTDWAEADAPLLDEMDDMIRGGRARNATDAARLLVAAGRVAGLGGEAAKVRRLRDRFLARKT
ncbi:hypothetical protein GCM10009416_14300 [Craurococcus roseus]|uniref:Uncharacterized protein n=1 Tax=Craurococcus roseus TaxID=77585 RepID=A0ABN1EXE6_9PROT